MNEKQQPQKKGPISANAYTLFLQGEITFEELTGEPAKSAKHQFTKADATERKKSTR